MRVEAITDDNRMDAFQVIICNYDGGIEETIAEVTNIDDGVIIYDDDTPVGVCTHNLVQNYGHFITNCVVNEPYKCTKYAYRLLREMKRMTNRKRFIVSYEDDLHGYKGKTNSVLNIIETKSVEFGKNMRRIRGK